MSTFEWYMEPGWAGDLVFSGRVSASDLHRLRLDHVEKAMMRQPIESDADMLLILEMIFRRMKEQQSTAPTIKSLIDSAAESPAQT